MIQELYQYNINGSNLEFEKINIFTINLSDTFKILNKIK